MSTTEPVAGTAARRARQAQQRAGNGSHDETDSPPPTRRLLDPDALAALEEERDFLLRSLRDLEREHAAGDVDEHDYAVLKDDYTARAADVLRAIETRQAARSSVKAAPDRTRRTVIAVLVAVFAVILGVGVAQSSGRRGAGDEITGADVRQTAREKALEARVAMGEGRFREAIGLFDEVTRLSPSNVEARAYKGWLLVLTSRQAPAGPDQDLLRRRAAEELDKAVELDPRNLDARIFRASLRSDIGDPAGGIADLDALRADEVPPELRPRVDSLRTRLGQQQQQQSAPAPG